MSLYLLVAKPVRFSQGQSAVHTSAYNNRTQLHHEMNGGETHDYSGSGPILFSGIFAPKIAPEWAHDREQLWNRAEAAETWKTKGQPARNLLLALPHELTDQQREFLVKDFVRETFVRRGMIADVAIHPPHAGHDERNHHAHILLTMRNINADGFEKTKNRSWNDQQELQHWHENWSRMGAKALARAGFEREAEQFKVGHIEREKRREIALERGDEEWAAELEKAPTLHMGPAVAGMERRGELTEIGDRNRDIAAYNGVLLEMKNAERELVVTRQQIEAEQRKAAQAKADELARLSSFRGPKEKAAAAAEPDDTRQAGDLGKVAGVIRTAWVLSDNAAAFSEVLNERGLMIARVSPDEAGESRRKAEFAKEVGNWSAELKAGELVVVNSFGNAYRLNSRTLGEDRSAIQKALGSLPPSDLLSIKDSADVLRQVEREAFISAKQIERDKQPLGKTAGEIRKVWISSSRNPAAFAEKLPAHHLMLAAVSAADATASHRKAEFAKEIGNWSAELKAGELVVVNSFGNTYRLTSRILGDDPIEIEKAFSSLDRSKLLDAAACAEKLQFRQSPAAAPTGADMVTQQTFARKTHEKAMRRLTPAQKIAPEPAAKTEVKKAGPELFAAPKALPQNFASFGWSQLPAMPSVSNAPPKVEAGPAMPPPAGLMVELEDGRQVPLVAYAAQYRAALPKEPGPVDPRRLAVDPAARLEQWKRDEQAREAQKREAEALTRIGKDLDSGRRLRAEDVRSLTRERFDRIQERGDRALRDMAEERKKEQGKEKGQARTRERD